MSGSKLTPDAKWDDYLEALIDAFKPFLLDTLRVSHLLCYLYLKEVKDRAASIHRKENNGFTKEAAADLLDAIKFSDEPGKWQMFMDALREVGDSIIYETLLGERSQDEAWLDNQANRSLINLFASRIDRYLKLESLLPKMVDKLILMDDMEQLNALIKAGKRREAHAILILRMHQHSTNWYSEFLAILCDDDHHVELAKMIDPEFCEKKGILTDCGDADSRTQGPRDAYHQPCITDPSSSQTSQPSSEQPADQAYSLGINLGRKASPHEKYMESKVLPSVSAGEGVSGISNMKQRESSCQCACCAQMLTKMSFLESELAEMKSLLNKLVASNRQ